MKLSRWLSVTTALAASLYAQSAMAGQEVLYAPPQEWVERAPQPTATGQTPILLMDVQQLAEEGRLTVFTDQAFRLDNPQSLNEAGTVSLNWMPDKGDLIVHSVDIIRDGAAIDVLAQGARFEVLRRETRLENRILDGSLTATLAVPGLRVRDILRINYSVTTSDQVLGKEVQSVAILPAAPLQMKSGRVRMLWPTKSDVKWKVTPGIDAVHGEANGLTTLDVKLPVAERPKVPEDAPLRYQMPALLQVSTFADWEEVSQVMAPYYQTKGMVKAGGPIAAQISRIKAAHSGKLEQAVAALRVVQDDIAYQLNGMDGGNYEPQKPSETWANLYGDCKAKTLLLLAMLHEMGIEAEAALVSATAGDAVPEMLPSAGAFNHVLVKAQIGGTTYWLDGTNSGASLASAADVPNFYYALPLRSGGAGLMTMERRPQAEAAVSSKITYDYSSGIDIPYLYDLEIRFSGSSVGQIRQLTELNEDQRLEIFRQMSGNVLGTTFPYDGGVSYDEATNTVTLNIAGVAESQWRQAGSAFSFAPRLATANYSFKPDRSRTAWRDIPVSRGQPVYMFDEATILLPVDSALMKFDGNMALVQEIAGTTLEREVKPSGKSVRIKDVFRSPGGEMPAAEALAERSKAARIPLSFSMETSAADARSYVTVLDGKTARYDRLEDAFTKAVALDDDNVGALYGRARFRNAVLNRSGALADVSAALDMEPDADGYMFRSRIYKEMGQLDEALQDAEEAHIIDSSLGSLLLQANLMQFTGQQKEALALLDNFDAEGADVYSVAQMASEIEASLGRKYEGLDRLEKDDRLSINNADLTNAICWYKGAWNFTTTDMLEICNEAVERASWTPAALDSRALAYYRLGKFTEALRDVNEALRLGPQLNAALYLRGHIRNKIKPRDGDQDIADALRRQPSLKMEYDRFKL